MNDFVERAKECEELAAWFDEVGMAYSAEHLRCAAISLRHRTGRPAEREPSVLTTEDALGERHCVPLMGGLQ